MFALERCGYLTRVQRCWTTPFRDGLVERAVLMRMPVLCAPGTCDFHRDMLSQRVRSLERHRKPADGLNLPLR
eukprot:6098202-Prymnesium_polylepis.2